MIPSKSLARNMYISIYVRGVAGGTATNLAEEPAEPPDAATTIKPTSWCCFYCPALEKKTARRFDDSRAFGNYKILHMYIKLRITLLEVLYIVILLYFYTINSINLCDDEQPQHIVVRNTVQKQLYTVYVRNHRFC